MDIWDEKKAGCRLVIVPTSGALRVICEYLNSLPKGGQHLFPVSAATMERVIHGSNENALSFTIFFHSCGGWWRARR